MPTETRAGGCHCGAIQFEAAVDLTQVMQCNCSICAKRGALWCFVKAPDVKFSKGEQAGKDYQFGKKRLHHFFCPTCGIGSFSRGGGPDGQDTIAINVRCLDDVDTTKLTPMPFDGKSL